MKKPSLFIYFYADILLNLNISYSKFSVDFFGFPG
jgi:hypothetical protein